MPVQIDEKYLKLIKNIYWNKHNARYMLMKYFSGNQSGELYDTNV